MSERLAAAGKSPGEVSEEDLRDYEGLFLRWRDLFDRAHHGSTLIRSSDVPVVHSRMGISKYYLMPQFEEFALSQWVVFVRDLSEPNGRHIHQGGIAIFILDGQGFSVINGQRVDWQAGDVVNLPLVEGGLDHQHFSAAGGAAKFMGIIYEPLIVAVGAEMTQLAPRETAQARGDVAMERDAAAPANLDAWDGIEPTLAGLVEVAHRQRETLRPPVLIRGAEAEVDKTEFGDLRWYMHPAMRGYGRTAPMLLFTQSLSTGQATSALRSPGNGFLYVLDGELEVTLDSDTKTLGPGDMALVPPRRNGVTLSTRALRGDTRALVALANLWSLGGVALGSDFALTGDDPGHS